MDNTQNLEPLDIEISLQSINYDRREDDPTPPNVAIQEEILWGEKYRALKASHVKPSILPKKSPINVPFKVCRERQRKYRESNRYSQPIKAASNISSSLLETELNFNSSAPSKNKPVPKTAPSLLERSALNQRQYMELLSTPNSKPKKNKKIKKENKFSCKCLVEPCPPRIVELSVPQKRLVISNWQRYAYTLSVERIEHLNNLLHTNKNLDPRDARYYFKQLDRLKRKEKRRKRLAKLRKLKKKERGNALWAKKEINFLSKAIVKYIKEEPLFALNYRQMLMSDNLLESLENKQFLKKPNRSTKCSFKKTTIEISDKTTVWIDSLLKFVDMHAVESEEEIVKIPSLYSMEFEGEEEEGESEEESSEGGEDKVKAERDLFDLEEGEDLFEGFEGFGEDLDFLNDLGQDLLEKLIRILGHCSDEFLLQEVNPDKMPGVTYADILERLKMLREGLRPDEESKSFLEQIMIDWAVRNEPENVDQPLLDKIHETAILLSDWLLSQGDFRPPGFDEGKQSGLDDITEEPTTTDEYGGATDASEERDEYYDSFEGGEDGLNEDFDSKYVEDMMDEEARREGDETSRQAEEEEEDLQKSNDDEVLQKAEEDELLQKAEEDEVLQKAEQEDEVLQEADEDEVLQKADEDGVVQKTEEEEALYQGGEDEYLHQTDDERGRSETDEEARRQTEGDLTGQGVEEGFDMGDRDVEGGMGVGDGTDLYNTEGEEEAGWTEDLDEFGRPMVESGIAEARHQADDEAEKIAWETEEAKVIAKIVDEKKVITEKSDKGEVEEFDLLRGVIKGHKPSVTFEHAPDTVCCLSLKIWAVWLLEITHNAHNWTQWLSNVIQKVREFAGIVRGDIVLPNGKKKVLYKEEWRQFAKETEEMAVTWRQYSKHVRDLTEKIVENFHKKTVNCCPKCLEDHLIKNVVTAHETLQALTEAMNCAGYWQRCLDEILAETLRLTNINIIKEGKEIGAAESSEFSGIREIEEIYQCPCAVRFEASEESIYEIEELL